MYLDVNLKEVCDIDLDVIDNILNNIEENDWYVDDYRKHANNMSETASIPIFHSEECGTNPKSLWTIERRPLFNKYYPLIEPILNQLKTYYDYNYHASFISKVNPYGTIGIHQDFGEFLERCHRIHIPLKTNENVFYYIDGEEYVWMKGKCYEFNNMLPHGVFNRSNEDRIHLVLNLYKLKDFELNFVKENI